MNVKQNLFVAFALLMLLPLTAGAKPRAKADMKKTAARAINLQTTLNSNKTNAPASSAARNAGQLRELKQTHTYTVFGYTDGGFAVISADDLAPELLGVSESDYTQSDNPGFNWWLKAIDEVITKAVKTNTPLTVIKPDPAKHKADANDAYNDLGTADAVQQIAAQHGKRTIAYRLCGNGNGTGAELF